MEGMIIWWASVVVTIRPSSKSRGIHGTRRTAKVLPLKTKTQGANILKNKIITSLCLGRNPRKPHQNPISRQRPSQPHHRHDGLSGPGRRRQRRAPRERSAPSAASAAAASPDTVGSSSRPPLIRILLDDDDAPPPQRRRPSVAPGAPRYVAPDIPLLLGSRAAVAVAPDSVLPRPFRVDLDAAGSGIPRSSVPGSVGPGIAVVAEALGFSTSSSVGSYSVQAFSSAASASGASSPVSLDNGDQSERDDQESAEHALKFIVAEIDPKIIETATVGGPLLVKFSEAGLHFQVNANPFRGSILWKVVVPRTGQDPASVSEVPYILFVFQAEEFCDLIRSGSFLDHVLAVRNHYPTFTICYVINKLMNYINICERNHYRNPSSSSPWRRPPVEEVLCKIATHHARVHSRQCADEAEVAEHVVGLTSSLANCKFRKPPTWLSVHANGVSIPQVIIDRDPSRNDTWMKSLIAIPKVQPRFALAIWKKYGTMRSLLNAYMDPNKTDLEKELLLQYLKCEDNLGEETRRLGPICSRRVYKTLMGQNGSAEVDPAA